MPGPLSDSEGRKSVSTPSVVTLWTGRVISGLASAMFIFSAAMRLKGGRELAQGMAHLGLPDTMVLPLAIVELTCVAIYLIPPTAVLGAILLAGYMGGAI